MVVRPSKTQLTCSEYKLACLNWCYQLLYPASMVNFIWFTDTKNVYRISTKQHGVMKSGVSRSKKSTTSQAVSAVHCRAGRCKSQAIYTSV